MSRFGRNYVEVGLYTESYFPENNIHFIASADGENETIARLLQENKVLVPMAYWRSKGLNRGGKKS